MLKESNKYMSQFIRVANTSKSTITPKSSVKPPPPITPTPQKQTQVVKPISEPPQIKPIPTLPPPQNINSNTIILPQNTIVNIKPLPPSITFPPKSSPVLPPPPPLPPSGPAVPIGGTGREIDCRTRTPVCCCVGHYDNAGRFRHTCINNKPVALIPNGQERIWLPPICNGGFEAGCGVWIGKCLYRKVPYQASDILSCYCKYYLPPQPEEQKCPVSITKNGKIYTCKKWNSLICIPPKDSIILDGCLCTPTSLPLPPPPPPAQQTYSLNTYMCSASRPTWITYFQKGFLDKKYPEIIGYGMCSGFRRNCPIAENVYDAAKLATYFCCAFYFQSKDLRNKTATLDYITCGK